MVHRVIEAAREKRLEFSSTGREVFSIEIAVSHFEKKKLCIKKRKKKDDDFLVYHSSRIVERKNVRRDKMEAFVTPGWIFFCTFFLF